VLVAGDAFYVVDDEGFHRHVESETVDRQVLAHLGALIENNEELISEGTMKMIGQEDIFTKAAIETQLRDLDSQFDALLEQGLPAEVRTWMGMLGFKIVIDVHGEVIEVVQPGIETDPLD
jgi:hypothetical protein